MRYQPLPLPLLFWVQPADVLSMTMQLALYISRIFLSKSATDFAKTFPKVRLYSRKENETDRLAFEFGLKRKGNAEKRSSSRK